MIRLARPDEDDLVLAVGDLDVEGEVFVRESIGDGRVRVSEIDGVIAGYVIVTPRRFFGRDFVDYVFVAPQHRRSGLARQLLADVLASATHTVFISTNESNAPMRALLDAEGWTFAGSVSGLDAGDPERFYWHSGGH